MIVKEYRLLLPVNVEEYRIAQRFMVARAAQEEAVRSGGGDDGVEIVVNAPYERNEHGLPPGQYTEKRLHLRKRVPAFVRAILPDAALTLTERAWNAYPRAKTVYSNAWLGERFVLSIDSVYTDEPGTLANALQLPDAELRARAVEYLNIACEDALAPFEPGFHPARYESKRSQRGRLAPDWFLTEQRHLMCAYKLVHLQCRVFGAQTKLEQWGQLYGLRLPFVQYHRKLFCWMDDWLPLDLDDLAAMEEQTVLLTQRRRRRSADAAADSAGAKSAKAPKPSS